MNGYSAADAFAEEIAEYDDEQLLALAADGDYFQRWPKAWPVVEYELRMRNLVVEAPKPREATHCRTCGQALGIEQYDEHLWDLYHRIRDGRQHREALVFDGEWLNENVVDDDDHDILMLAMDRDMHHRGLCTGCGRPDLTRVDPADILTEDEAQELADMYAEQAAERRAGC